MCFLFLTYFDFSKSLRLLYSSNKSGLKNNQLFQSVTLKLYRNQISIEKANFFRKSLVILKEMVLNNTDSAIFEIKDFFIEKNGRESVTIEFVHFLQKHKIISSFVVLETRRYDSVKGISIERKIQIHLLNSNIDNFNSNNNYWTKANLYLTNLVSNVGIQQEALVDVFCSDSTDFDSFENLLAKIVDISLKEHSMLFKKVKFKLTKTKQLLNFVPLVIERLTDYSAFIKRKKKNNFLIKFNSKNVSIAHFFLVNKLISHFVIKKHFSVQNNDSGAKIEFVPFIYGLNYTDSTCNEKVFYEKVEKLLNGLTIINNRGAKWKVNYDKYNKIFTQIKPSI